MRCRTCFNNISSQAYHALDELDINEKTLAEIILEIAKIDTKIISTVESQFLCSVCVETIRMSYEFVLQAQKVHEQWLYLNTNDTNAILDEVPIDIDESWEIKPDVESFIFKADDSKDVLSEVGVSITQKMEDVKEEQSPFISKENLRNNKRNRPLDASDNEAEESLTLKRGRKREQKSEKETEIKVDINQKQRGRGRPRKIATRTKPEVEILKKNSEDQTFLKNTENDAELSDGMDVYSDADFNDEYSSGDERIEEKLKKRKTRQRREYANVCEICKKSFFKHKDLIIHVKEHSIEPEFNCDYCDQLFLKKENLDVHMKIHSKSWLNDNNTRAQNLIEFKFIKMLYEKQTVKVIKCQLCDREFKKISELRTHLVIHKDSNTITQFPKEICLGKTEETNDELKSRICRDIENKKLNKFYMIINENGYELCLSESESEEDEDNSTRYKCMLCNQTFNRNYKMFAHTLESHSNDKPPFKCSICKFNFVCLEMLHQHLRRQCRNRFKKYKCSHCPGRFVWEENSNNHNCPNPHNTPYRNYNKHKKVNNLQCEQCDKIFMRLRDLKRHSLIHAKKSGKLKCKFCENRTFHRKDNLRSHLKNRHGNIQNVEAALDELKYVKKTQVQDVSDHLKRPHGCKIVECMICQSKRMSMRISDMKDHLLNHQNNLSSYADSWENVENISELLYPELRKLTSKEELVTRIKVDLAANQFQRFFSITNEAGCELDLSSSETDSDSEPDDELKYENKTFNNYICEACNASFDRKHKIFEHQAQQHKWDEANHVCSHCGSRFVSDKLLLWHQKRQCTNPLKRFVCKKCPLRFIWKQNRATHMRTHALSEKKERAVNINCPHCKRQFMNKNNFDRHLQMSTCRDDKDKIIKCFYCARKFYHIDNLSAHMLRHGVTAGELQNAESLLKATNNTNGAKQVMCRICNTNFSSITALRIHLLNESNSTISKHFGIDSPLNYMITNSLGFEMHIDDSETEDDFENIEHNFSIKSSYQCQMCLLVFKRKYQMSQHQLSYHKYQELPFKCDRCVFRTASQDILEHHMRSQCFNEDKKIVCDICQYKFLWPESLETHKKLNHAGGEKLKITQKIFECKDCLTKYSSKKLLNAHLRKMHSTPTTDANSCTVSKQGKIFLCTTCGASLNSSASFNRHVRRHNNENPYSCDVCNKPFPCISQLSNHRKTHTGEKPHICTVCNRGFTRAKGLIAHMRTHTGERPLNCPYCEKTFSSHSSLSVHKRRHTGERPYVCQVCGASFIKNELLKKHRNLLGHHETPATEVV